MTRLWESQYVAVQPHGFREAPPAAGGPKYGTYASLMLSFSDYAQIPLTETTYDDLMLGQPGWPGGAPARPVGIGVEFGERRNDIEWWLTDATGLEDSAAWGPVVEQRASGDGTWVLGVRAAGREVTLTGHLVSVLGDRRDLAVALGEAAAALAATPRTGWLLWDAPDGEAKRLPVSLSGATKVKRVSNRSATIQMSLTGVDIGSPGAGVHLEQRDPQLLTLDNTIRPVTVEGLVPTPPILRVQGPLDAGCEITLGEFVVTIPEAVLASQTITVDCRQKYVDVNGAPDRSRVILVAWPVLPVGAVDVSAVFSGGGRVQLEVTALW